MSGASHSVRRATVVAKAPLAAVAALLGFTLLTVFAHARPPADAHPSPVARERLLRFADREDGAVVVTDGADGRVVAVVTGQNGFLRGAMSGLARIRRTEGIGRAVPFRLTLYADRRLTLSDPATGKAIELEAFGPTNEAVFANFLALPGSGRG